MGRKGRPQQAANLALLLLSAPLAGCASDGASREHPLADASSDAHADEDASSIATEEEDSSVTGSADAGADSSSGGSYELDLAHWYPERTPTALPVGDSYTIEFPLTTDSIAQTLSAEAPGDLVLAYTRVVCPDDPNGWIGPLGAVPAQLRDTAPVRITEVTIELFSAVNEYFTAQQRAEVTCLTLRSEDGTWRAYSPSPSPTVLGESLRLQFTLDGAAVNAAAIFMPTGYVTRISYRVDE